MGVKKTGLLRLYDLRMLPLRYNNKTTKKQLLFNVSYVSVVGGVVWGSQRILATPMIFWYDLRAFFIFL